MGIHYWGDEDFDWTALSSAISDMSGFMRRWGRLGVHSKEKYGTARLYMYPYCGGLFSLFYPGYVSYWPWSSKKHIGKYLMWLEYKVFQPVSRLLKLYVPINWWQLKVYNWAYQRALKKYPQVAEEIIEDADWPEYIKDWHKHMWPGVLKANEEVRDRWLKTADFYNRLLKEVAEFDDKGNMVCVKADPGPTYDDINKIHQEYKDFDGF
jgi:hypothetical protein